MVWKRLEREREREREREDMTETHTYLQDTCTCTRIMVENWGSFSITNVATSLRLAEQEKLCLMTLPFGSLT